MGLELFASSNNAMAPGKSAKSAMTENRAEGSCGNPKFTICQSGFSPLHFLFHLPWRQASETNVQIGGAPRISPRMVQRHLEHIYGALPVSTRTALPAIAFRVGAAQGL
jgi:hypothetical protein